MPIGMFFGGRTSMVTFSRGLEVGYSVHGAQHRRGALPCPVFIDVHIRPSFNEIPPVSNVMPFPTNPSVGWLFLPGSPL